MTDPAIEAAKRAGMTKFPPRSRVLAMTTAREALSPLRELHKLTVDVHGRPGSICDHCEWEWPCPSARLIYREDEL